MPGVKATKVGLCFDISKIILVSCEYWKDPKLRKVLFIKDFQEQNNWAWVNFSALENPRRKIIFLNWIVLCSLHKKWSFIQRISSVTVDSVTFPAEILNGNIHFLCSGFWIYILIFLSLPLPLITVFLFALSQG